MSQRIRYTNLTDNTIQSARTYISGEGINLRVLIDTKDLEFIILNDKSIVQAQGKGSYLHEVKLKAKDALLSLGVSFSEELRMRVQKCRIR